MASTLRDVAARAGVSAITVSRALNNTGYVSPDTRRRIYAAAAELDYVPNAVARSLRSSKTHLLALLLTDITNPFWTTIARAVEDVAMESGYGVLLCNTDEDQAKEASYLDLLLRRQIDGLVVVPTSESTQILLDLKKRRVPFVLVDRVVREVEADNVRGDSRQGAYDMTRHLLATGYHHIAMLSGPLTVSTAEERVAGYLDAHADHGLRADPDLVFYGNFRASWSFEATQEIMARRNRPDAIFAANNFIGLGVLEALRVVGLRVPDDVAVVCFDDISQYTSSPPFLTTVVQPAQQMGRVAANLLLDRLAGPDREPREIVLPTELIIRTSCGCAPEKAAGINEAIWQHPRC
jgi:LacI family transcriptional regulator